jgi:DNA polymerase bacteriophage-type
MLILDRDCLLVTLDFETYYAPKYTLTAMNTFTYVDHELFSIHGVGVQIENGKPRWYRDTEEALADIERAANGKPIALLCQNTYFDGWILHRKFDWHADLYLDTMGMSRGLFPGQSAGLEPLCERLWPNDPKMRKGKELIQFKGVTTDALWANDALEQAMADYCIGSPKRQGDVPLTYAAFCKMLPFYPDEELELIDLTLQMHCKPILHIDVPRVIQCRDNAIAERNALIKASGLSETKLSSNVQFEQWLISQGIPVPLKPSPTQVENDPDTGEERPVMIPALGKSDLGFLELRKLYPEHEAVWKGRVAAKSVGEITRAERFIATAEQCDGLMPVPLIYYAAHTGRYGGGEKLNLQNLGRGSELRRSLSVPTYEVTL